MNLVVNQEDLASSLSRYLFRKKLAVTPFKWTGLDHYVASCKQEYKRSQHIVIDFNQVNKLINKEINAYKQRISYEFKSQLNDVTEFLIKKNFLEILPHEFVLKTYLQDPRPGFIKTVGPQLSESYKFVTDLSEANLEWPFLIRNVINNEYLLNWCRENQHEFWFIDSGYTNFLVNKKKLWHRLVHNHIHHGLIDSVAYPDDRLHLLPNLPRKWRKKGRTVLVVESSENHYRMQGTSLDEWRYKVTKEIESHTDRPIEYRSKAISRKNRNSVYDLLQDSKAYHCIISDSSSAAIESIWAGVPAITLDRHITNSVTRQNICDIENLYKGDIQPWLNAISYNQFTFEELCNGTAVDIIGKYGTV